ncbi:MAG TPA: response regulator transcription factor [Candidatus Faecivivens stercoripullorum]|uniref:Stage 0 sporulation protein A homolog n=1 Tax=Candidatus Faecivivens stercoripullorum TaxID=2840805 RepID=A0A9D1H5N8_9FIRM|nr:response regulator transcription factor [Candidatus Faecivivens stercoripullorum]
MQTIYIVEDDRNIREIEMLALKNSGYRVQGYETAREFYAAMADRLPSLVMLDIMLPDEDGISILQNLRRRADTRRLPVILVTAKGEEIDKVRGFDSGADDYIAKPFGVMEMIARVKALLRRSSEGETKFLTLGNVFLDGEKRMAYVDDRPVELTLKEYELLHLLMLNKGIVLSRDLIMERVWDGYESESRTLDMHIKSLRKKLGDSASMIRTMRGVGYIAEAPAAVPEEKEG